VSGGTFRLALGELRSLVSLAVPLVIGLVVATALSLTDTIIVSPLGSVPLAAISVTSSVVVIFYAGIYGLLSVVGVEIAQAHGSGDGRRAAAAIRRGLRLGAFVGVGAALAMAALLPAMGLLGQPPDVLAVLPQYYLPFALLLVPFAMFIVLKQMFDSIDRPWLGVAFAGISVVVNVPLTVLLVHGWGPVPSLGLLGAGIASVVSEVVGFLAALAMWRVAASTRRLRVRARSHPLTTRGLAMTGAPLGVGYVAETAAFALAGLMMGWLGTAALAANQITNSIGSMLYMVPMGMASAVAIRVGQAEGGGMGDRLRPIAFAAMGAVSVWMLMVTVVLAFSGRAIADSLSDDPAVIAIAASLFVVMALMQVFDGLQSTAQGALRGLLDLQVPTAITMVSYWLLALPAAWLLAFPLGFGPPGLWMGFGLGLAVAAVLLPLRFLHITRARGV